MVKGTSTAYVALPMDLVEEDAAAAQRAQRRAETASCITCFGKLCTVFAALSLVVLGGMHMSGCGGKQHSNQTRNQLRSHHFGAWKPRNGNHHGMMDVPGPHHGVWGPRGGHHHPEDALPGPHHVPHGTFLGPDHHRQHDEDMPAILRHPKHKPTGKNQAVMHVQDDHPDPSDLQELKAIKKNHEVIKHVIDSTHHNTLPQELRHPLHHGGKLNTVKVKRAPQAPENTEQVDVEMPGILRHPPKRTNGNGKQGTYVVHRHHDAPAPREAAPAQESSSEEDAMLDAELEELERDYNKAFRHESQDFEEEEETEEEYEAKLEAELEELEKDLDEDFGDFEWDSEEDEIEEWDEDEDEDLNDEILEAFEDAEDEDVEVMVVEERLEEP